MNIGHYKAALAGAIASQFALVAFLSIDHSLDDAVKPGVQSMGTTPSVMEPAPTTSVVSEEYLLVSREELMHLIEFAVNRGKEEQAGSKQTQSDDEIAPERARINNDTHDSGNQALVAQEVNEELNQVAIEGEISLDRLSGMLAKMEQLNEGDRNVLTTELIRNINQQKINFETTY